MYIHIYIHNIYIYIHTCRISTSSICILAMTDATWDLVTMGIASHSRCSRWLPGSIRISSGLTGIGSQEKHPKNDSRFRINSDYRTTVLVHHYHHCIYTLGDFKRNWHDGYDTLGCIANHGSSA